LRAFGIEHGADRQDVALLALMATVAAALVCAFVVVADWHS
jgi:hypothetical protein